MSAGQLPETSHNATANTTETVIAHADVVDSEYDNEQQIARDVSIANNYISQRHSAFYRRLSICLSVCLFVSTITHKVMN